MSSDTWVDFSPPWAPHVKGSYTDRTFDEDGLPEEQKVRATCTVCGTVFQRTCASGQVRTHITTFARLHVHRDPLNDPMPRG